MYFFCQYTDEQCMFQLFWQQIFFIFVFLESKIISAILQHDVAMMASWIVGSSALTCHDHVVFQPCSRLFSRLSWAGSSSWYRDVGKMGWVSQFGLSFSIRVGKKIKILFSILNWNLFLSFSLNFAERLTLTKHATPTKSWPFFDEVVICRWLSSSHNPCFQRRSFSSLSYNDINSFFHSFSSLTKHQNYVFHITHNTAFCCFLP